MININNKQIKAINTIMEVNDSLCPSIFSIDSSMLYYVKERLLSIANLAVDMLVPFFPNFKLYDIVLGGSICGYVYNKDSDLDIFIIISDIIPQNQVANLKITEYLSEYILSLGYFPTIYSRKVDVKIRCVSQYRKGISTYSLLNNYWISEPQKGGYNFTPQQLWASYQFFEKNIQQAADKLCGDAKYLTQEDCQKLKRLLYNVRLESFTAKEQDDLHEYSVKYSVYRIAQYLGLFKKYEDLIAISTQKNQREEHE